MLSPLRTLTPVKSVTFHRALAGSAVAAAAVLTGGIAAHSAAAHSAAAHSAAAHSAAAHSAAAHSAVGSPAAANHVAANHGAALSPTAASQLASISRSPFTSAGPPRLDAFLATSAKPQMSSGGGKGGKAARLTPRQIARRLLHRFHWSRRQFRYLDPLWARESSWNVRAFNPYSGAYGIPQAMPGSKMASAGPDWEGRARTQILWGLRYIKADYGSPRAAWEHELATGWY